MEDSFVNSIVPPAIRRPKGSMNVGTPYGESEALSVLRDIAKKNRTDVWFFIDFQINQTNSFSRLDPLLEWDIIQPSLQLLSYVIC